MSLTRSLIFGTVLTSALFASAAQASGVYLLQLGSFEDKGKAQERWESLQGKYPSLLEDLNVRLMDVTLPPDNFTVYRTQAGALSNRADAQSICDRLSSRGDECYVVETAMFNPSHALAKAPNPPLSIKGTEAFASAALPTTSRIAAPTVTAPALIAPRIEAPRIIEPALAAPAIAAPTLGMPDVDLSTDMGQTIDPLEPVRNEKEKGFWSWLNPFGGDDEIDDNIALDVDVDTAPPSISMPDMDTPTLLADADFPELQTNVPPLIESPMAPAASAMGVDMEMPVNMDPVMDIDTDEPFQLPPPPAPRSEQAMAQVLQERAEASRRISGVTMQPTAPSAPRMANNAGPREIAPRLFTDRPATITGSAQGVDVEEAIQVPLSQQTVPNVPQNRFPTAGEMKAMGMPSQSVSGKSHWAQIYYFSNQQTALGYWDAFRASNPDFPAKRVRVTSPYKSTGKQRVALRVGPFDNAAEITRLCLDIETQEIRCSAMTDIGASSRQASGPRGLNDRYAQRYQTAPRLKNDMYWVQLGSYASPEQANGAFSQLAMNTKPMMDNIQPSIAAPIMSSAMEPIYRLRTGPYAMRGSADQLCTQLRQRGTTCGVIFGK